MDGDDGIKVDGLAVGLTRPETILGVPYAAVVFNVLVSVEVLSLTSNLLWLLMCIPNHGICYVITLKDPRAFELLMLWGRTTLRTLISSLWYWSAASYSPLSFRERPGFLKRWCFKRRHNREDRA